MPTGLAPRWKNDVPTGNTHLLPTEAPRTTPVVPGATGVFLSEYYNEIKQDLTTCLHRAGGQGKGTRDTPHNDKRLIKHYSLIINTMSTITKTKIEIDPALLAEAEEKGQIIVHCHFIGKGRIWRSTFLIDAETGKRAKLLHAENITLYPEWKVFGKSNPVFTLIFESLPKSCKSFHLHEIIPEPGGWVVKNITRKKSDVYHVHL